MRRNKVVEMGDFRFKLRGLTFEELVKLGSANNEAWESKDVVAEVLSQCIMEPMLKIDQIVALEDKTLVTLMYEVLDIPRKNK